MNTKIPYQRHLLVIDSTAYTGGSKIATENILKLLNSRRMRVTVLTADCHSWNWPTLKRMKLYQPEWLAKKEQGVLYFLRHFFIALSILIIRLRTGKIDIALGASGPGVDLGLYLIKPVLGFKIVQLIHGPVARSRTIGRCLSVADKVYYLESCKNSLLSALSTTASKTKVAVQRLPANFHIMINGLPFYAWPNRCQYKVPTIFWAASLLKWKGLDVLLAALYRIDNGVRPETCICYIRPKETPLPMSSAPVKMEGIYWHENPRHINVLRSFANIFVSTSKNEPFGLSILEAMAAGHCVLIPADGAYWDRILEDGINCIKYRAGDAEDLAEKLLAISSNMNRIKMLGEAASNIAFDYRAENRYAEIKRTLEGGTLVTHAKLSSKDNSRVIS